MARLILEACHMLTKFISVYCRFLEVLIAVALAVMVVLVFGNVVLRYAFNSGLTLSEELSRWLFVWMTFLGAVVAMKDGAHLGSDTLVSKLSLKGQKVFLVIGHALMLFICWLLFVGSLNQALINWESTSPVMELSMGLFYGCGMVLAASGALILLDRLLRLAMGQLEDSELIGVRESEEEPIDVPAPLK
jgi:TRAP-type C4-dicarboxylate transport system permease small subunit